MKCINCNAKCKKVVRLSMLMLSIAVLLTSCPMNQPNGGDENNGGDSTLPVVSVSVSPARVMEASPMDADRTLTFTVSVTPAPAEGRTLSVGLSPAVDKTAGTWSPTIAAGTSTELTSTQASMTYTFVASASDADIEDGTVSLTLQEGEGYTLKADARSAQASVVDSRVVIHRGTANVDTLTGADNVPETFVGAGGNDTINGGAGSGDIALYEQAGSFAISLASGTYTVASPSEGMDMLTGIETIRLSPMNDSVNSGITGITIDGGAGTDTIQLADTGITFDLSTATNYINFEIVRGGTGDDTFTGTAEADSYSNGGGEDTVNTNAGNDTIQWNNASGSINAGADVDTVIFSTTTDIHVNLFNTTQPFSMRDSMGIFRGGNLGGNSMFINNSDLGSIMNVENIQIATDVTAYIITSDSANRLEPFSGTSASNTIIFVSNGGNDTLVVTSGNLRMGKFSNDDGNNDKLDFSINFPTFRLNNLSFSRDADDLQITGTGITITIVQAFFEGSVFEPSGVLHKAGYTYSDNSTLTADFHNSTNRITASDWFIFGSN